MDKTEKQIIAAVRGGRWVASSHADDRLAERRIETWQVVEGFDDGETILVDPDAVPNPKILRRQRLPDGIEVVVVWSYDHAARVAKLVTVYFEEAL